MIYSYGSHSNVLQSLVITPSLKYNYVLTRYIKKISKNIPWLMEQDLIKDSFLFGHEKNFK